MPVAGSDAGEVSWFDLTSLPSLAFDHNQIIQDVIRNLPQAQGYCDSRGLFPARKAVTQYCREKGIDPVDAVRIEEMLNYFNYDYPEPEGKHPFSVYTELSDCPWNTRYQILPKKQFEDFAGPERTLPRGKGHHAEWIEACKGRGESFSSFQIGAPMTELIQLGNAAVLIGEPCEFDTLSGQIINRPDANRHLHRQYRDGWTL